MVRKLLCMVIVLSMATFNFFAFDFSLTTGAGDLYFKIIDKDKHLAEVTYPGKISAREHYQLNGIVEIPPLINHKGTIYTISRIGRKAFREAEGLTTIVLSDSIKEIDNFAFENCRSLRSVKYPDKAVEVSRFAYVGCTSLKATKLQEALRMAMDITSNNSSLEFQLIPFSVRELLKQKIAEQVELFSKCTDVELEIEELQSEILLHNPFNIKLPAKSNMFGKKRNFDKRQVINIK